MVMYPEPDGDHTHNEKSAPVLHQMYYNLIRLCKWLIQVYNYRICFSSQAVCDTQQPTSMNIEILAAVSILELQSVLSSNPMGLLLHRRQ